MGMEREYEDAMNDPVLGELNAEAVALLKRLGIRGRAAMLVHVDEHGRYTFFIAKGVNLILDSAAAGILDAVDAAVTANADLEKSKQNGRMN